MSGVEIAGFVLAGFPIIVSAAEHYKEGFEILQDWKRFRTDFIDFIDAVDLQQQPFRNNLEQLLWPFVDSETKLQALLTDPTSEAWRNQELEEKLKARLADSYEVYLRTIKKMDDTMEYLKRLLSLKDGQVDWAYDGANEWNYQLKRVRISFSKKKVKKLAALEKYNSQLADLLRSNDALGPSRVSRKSKPLAAFFQMVQNHACGLHMVLKYGWRCDCPAPHRANLQLQKRTENDQTSQFKVLFVLETRLTEPTCRPPTIWQETEFKVLEEECQMPAAGAIAPRTRPMTDVIPELRAQFEYKPDSTGAIKGVGPAGVTIASSNRVRDSEASTASSNSTIINYLIPSMKAKKKVYFADTVTQPRPSPPQTPNHRNISRIEDLCSAILSPKLEGICLGYLLDNQQRRHELYPTLKPWPVSHPHEVVTLEDLLLRRNGITLTRRERLIIAAILASSLVQLHNTPWLSESWNKREIFFHRASDGSSRPIVEQPYVSQSFLSSNVGATTASPPVGPLLAAKLDVKRSLFALGVMLLELCFGERIEDQPIRKKFLQADGQPNDITDFSTAIVWQERVFDEDAWFPDPIRRCVSCAFDPRPNWADEQFRQAVYSGVVEPLQKALRAWE